MLELGMLLEGYGTLMHSEEHCADMVDVIRDEVTL